MAAPIEPGPAGLSALERDVYLALMDVERVGVDEVAERVGIVEIAARAALDVLRAQGLVVMHSSDPARYSAVHPRSPLSALASGLEKDADRLRSSIPELVARYRRGRDNLFDIDTQLLSLSDDPGVVAGWYAQLQHDAVNKFVVFDRPPYISAPMPELESRSLRSGASHRAVYAVDSFSRPGALAEIRAAQSNGERSRVVDELPIKMAVADESAAVVCLSVADGVSDSAFVRSEPLIRFLLEMFETYWARGVSFAAEDDMRPGASHRPKRHGGPDEQSRAILSLVGAGITDEAIAARLGISVRSVRRRISDMMASLGARNRFHFGVLAARRDWI